MTDSVRRPPARRVASSGSMRPVRPTRVIYVENDPALRGILGGMLADQPALDLLLVASGPDEVLDHRAVLEADVALIDLALGLGVMNGIDLGLALRERNEDLGVVIHSQHEPAQVLRRVPADELMGWSFVPKSGDMDIDELVSVIRATAQGMSHDLAGNGGSAVVANALDELSTRQRAVMALAATGLTAPEIGRRLGLTHDAVRKDLSRAYRVLVPGDEGGDLRTKAVLAYLQLMRDRTWDESTS